MSKYPVPDSYKDEILDKLCDDQISILNIEGGAAIEMFDRALAKVMGNVADINTKLKIKRTIVLKVNIIPMDENRDLIDYELDCDMKLANQHTVVGKADVRAVPGKGFVAIRRDPQSQLPIDNVTPITTKTK